MQCNQDDVIMQGRDEVIFRENITSFGLFTRISKISIQHQSGRCIYERSARFWSVIITLVISVQDFFHGIIM